MSEFPTPPFPELRALDATRPLPSMAELLKEAQAPGLPAPPAPLPSPQTKSPLLQVPRIPRSSPASDLSGASHAPRDTSPVTEMPVEKEDREESMQETIAALLTEEIAGNPTQHHHDRPAALDPTPAESPTIEGTDAELAEAFAPILESGINRALRGAENGLQAFLEPMLRATVRRAIAEQMESSRQFRQLGAFDRLAFRLLALFTSRTYDDIVFDRTHRYQVEEAYLLSRQSKTLLSYAHHDPGSHVSPRRVRNRVRELIHKVQAPDGGIESSFDLPDRRLALVREGKHCLLVGVLRGRANALVRADLDYVLRQAEDRFGERLETKSDAFIRVLQPILEGCLLIQSPAPPH